MYINYQWNQRYDSKSPEFLGMPIERILHYELEAKFTIESDDGQVFSEDFVPIYLITSALKNSKLDLVEIDLEGWSCNPFLIIEKQGSRMRIKNDFIDFECNQEDYVLETEQFIYLVEKEIREMGFKI
jgi:hypothetical protein